MLDIEILAEDAMREEGVDRKKVMAMNSLLKSAMNLSLACIRAKNTVLSGRLVIQMEWLLSWIFVLTKLPLRQRCSVLLSIFSIMIALFR